MPCKIVWRNERSWERKVLGTKVPRNERSRERKFPGTLVPRELKFPRTKRPGNESSRGLPFPGNESSRERKVSGTKVPHRDYSFLGTKGLGHEKSRYLHLRAKCHLDPSNHLAAADMGRKLGRLCPFGGERDGSPCNPMWPGLRPTCMPSFILIQQFGHSANVTDKTDRQDNGPVA